MERGRSRYLSLTITTMNRTTNRTTTNHNGDINMRIRVVRKKHIMQIFGLETVFHFSIRKLHSQVKDDNKNNGSQHRDGNLSMFAM